MRLVAKLFLALVGLISGLLVVALICEINSIRYMPSFGATAGLALGYLGWVLVEKMQERKD